MAERMRLEVVVDRATRTIITASTITGPVFAVSLQRSLLPTDVRAGDELVLDVSLVRRTRPERTI
jgi:hypothetical protein